MHEKNTKHNPKQIVDLKNRTGFGLNKCSQAMKEAMGDFDKALEILSKISGKAPLPGHSTKEGNFGIYEDNNHFAVIQLGCQTESVAKTPLFIEAAQNIAKAYAENPAIMTEEFKNNLINTEYGLKIRPFGEVISIIDAYILHKKDGVVYHMLHQSGINNALAIIQMSEDAQELGQELVGQVMFEKPLCIAKEDITEDMISESKEREVALLEQEFYLSDSPTSKTLVKDHISEFAQRHEYITPQIIKMHRINF